MIDQDEDESWWLMMNPDDRWWIQMSDIDIDDDEDEDEMRTTTTIIHSVWFQFDDVFVPRCCSNHRTCSACEVKLPSSSSLMWMRRKRCKRLRSWKAQKRTVFARWSNWNSISVSKPWLFWVLGNQNYPLIQCFFLQGRGGDPYWKPTSIMESRHIIVTWFVSHCCRGLSEKGVRKSMKTLSPLLSTQYPSLCCDFDEGKQHIESSREIVKMQNRSLNIPVQ